MLNFIDAVAMQFIPPSLADARDEWERLGWTIGISTIGNGWIFLRRGAGYCLPPPGVGSGVGGVIGMTVPLAIATSEPRSDVAVANFEVFVVAEAIRPCRFATAIADFFVLVVADATIPPSVAAPVATVKNGEPSRTSVPSSCEVSRMNDRPDGPPRPKLASSNWLVSRTNLCTAIADR